MLFFFFTHKKYKIHDLNGNEKVVKKFVGVWNSMLIDLLNIFVVIAVVVIWTFLSMGNYKFPKIDQIILKLNFTCGV